MEHIELQLVEKENLGRNVMKKSGRIYQYLVGKEGFDAGNSQSQRRLVENLNYLRKKENLDSVDFPSIKSSLGQLDGGRINRIKI